MNKGLEGVVMLGSVEEFGVVGKEYIDEGLLPNGTPLDTVALWRGAFKAILMALNIIL